MENPRKYGSPPFRVAVIHGGPGAAGEMAPVAKELSAQLGILEPLQTKSTIEGQAKELKELLEKNGSCPVILIGFSWGAWLSFLISAKYPNLVRKLILVGSGPFREKYAQNIMKTRLSRMDGQQRKKMISLMEILKQGTALEKNAAMSQLGRLIQQIDSYAFLPCANEVIDCRYNIYQSIWEEAEKLRNTGELLELGKKIECSTVAIHGDYDPHPSKGVKDPLSLVLKDFKFILLERCGHEPWLERYAKDKFYQILFDELK